MKNFLLLFFLFIQLKGLTQAGEPGSWYMYMGNIGLSKKWNLHAEAQYRGYNFFNNAEQILLRTGIGYNLSENNNNLLMGYAYVHSEPYIPITDVKIKTTEHRLFQQFITRQHFGRVYTQHRYRLEERFSSGSMKTRFRYFLSINIPINRTTLQKGSLYLSAYNELFINTSNIFFDRNRLYGAMGYQLSSNLRVELGAMKQMLASGGRTQLQFIVFNTLPFTNKH